MLVSKKELTNLKLKAVTVPDLRELADELDIKKEGKKAELVERLIDIPQDKIDQFIKRKFLQQIKERQSLISDEELKEELKKVKDFKWGVVQGQLDRKIQAEYVREFFRYKDLVNSVEEKLHGQITSYVICSWFNHWTTVLMEEHIAQHPKVVPTLKNVKGIDLFFDDQPLDLKITYLPEDFSFKRALKKPKKLAKWMYENQGAQRFGEDNRLFVVVTDEKNLNDSWKLKRDFDFIFSEIDNFLDNTSVTKKDEIVFSFKGKTYTTISKVLIISK